MVNGLVEYITLLIILKPQQRMELVLKKPLTLW